MDFTVMKRDKMKFSNRFCPTITELQEPESLQASDSKALTVNNRFHPILSGFRKSTKSKTSQKFDKILLSTIASK
jgi:hypothetical protein